MATNEFELQEQQRLRRKRINRMKTGIIMTIAIWMLASLIAIIILSVQVIKLNHQVSEIIENGVSADDTSSDMQAASSSEKEENRFTNVVTGIDTKDNFAEEGDTHYVYLTFNSVPGDNTEAILDVLAQHEVKATFFVVGSEAEGVSDVYQRIVEEGHTIGMHSYSNQYSLIYSSKEAFEQDYKKLSDYIYELTGKRSEYYRFPGGSGNAISNVNMAEFVYILNQEKITYFDWNVSAGDAANSYTTQDVLDNVLGGISKYKTSVVLLHDGENKSTTVEALGTLIEQLKSQGAVILPIDEDTNVIQYIKAESVK
ncbi:MAG: polysaccharide deacetylase [Agathobacter sp.]|nr:polysaccharide deacetylase [Agathobacter sp.]